MNTIQRIKMNSLLLLLFFMLGLILTAFSQDLTHTAQPYGEETLINFDVSWTGETYHADSGYHIYYMPDADLIEVIMITWDADGGFMETVENFDLSKDYRLNLYGVHDIFFRTTEGVTSLNFIRSDDKREASIILNGKLVLHYTDGIEQPDFGGRKPDHFKNSIDWAYTLDLFEISELSEAELDVN